MGEALRFSVEPAFDTYFLRETELAHMLGREQGIKNPDKSKIAQTEGEGEASHESSQCAGGRADECASCPQ
jgi:hypothetical protein